MLLMAAVNPLNDPDDFIDERQRLTLTYAATILVDDEDASFPPPAGLDIPTPDQGLSPPEWNPPIPHFLSPQPVVIAACAVERASSFAPSVGPSSLVCLFPVDFSAPKLVPVTLVRRGGKETAGIFPFDKTSCLSATSCVSMCECVLFALFMREH